MPYFPKPPIKGSKYTETDFYLTIGVFIMLAITVFLYIAMIIFR